MYFRSCMPPRWLVCCSLASVVLGCLLLLAWALFLCPRRALKLLGHCINSPLSWSHKLESSRARYVAFLWYDMRTRIRSYSSLLTPTSAANLNPLSKNEINPINICKRVLLLMPEIMTAKDIGTFGNTPPVLNNNIFDR